jgi:hypothetical protein
LRGGGFINSMFPQYFFLSFFPDKPFPVLTSVVVCHLFFLQSEIYENVKIQIGKAANGIEEEQKRPTEHEFNRA